MDGPPLAVVNSASRRRQTRIKAVNPVRGRHRQFAATTGRISMGSRSPMRTIALMAALCVPLSGALAFDQSKYPDWAGQWVRFRGAPGNFDPSKPRRAQQAPLTPEYQAIFEANLRDQDEGKQGTDPTYTCLSPGMPRIMNIYEPMEIVVTPETT